jgi:hypothetical protein
VPKSSIASLTPRSFSSVRRWTAKSVSDIITDSVISSTSDPGGRPLVSSAQRTSLTIESDWS